MILSSWERGEEIQPKYEYFEELLDQLKDLVRVERRNLMATTKDIWLWGKLWSMLLKIEKGSMEKREKFDVAAVRGVLVRFTELTDQVVQSATQRFSFSLNDAVRESVKTVRVEKSQTSGISIEERLADAGENVRFSYDNFKQWQRLVTNLIRNAFEAVEAKQSGAGPVVADLGLPGGEEIGWVKITTKPSEADIGQAGMPDPPGISVIIEDSGIGMNEATVASFYKRGFTSGKDGGLGLGVTEESIQLIEQYGGWEIESQKRIGTKITIGLDRVKAQKAELILPPERPFHRQKLVLGLSSAVLLVIIGVALLFALYPYSRFWVDWNPVSAKVENGKLLIVHNKEGDELWRRRFDREIQVRKEFDSEKGMEVVKQSVHVDDVNSDGKNEILLGFLESESETGFLLCLDYRSDELWSFPVGTTEVYEKGGQIYCPSSHVFIVDIDQDGEREIILSSNCKTWFPCQLLVLSDEGGKEGEYWHSGHFAIQFIKDMDGDGKQEIVCGGGTNHMGACPVAFVLDGMNVKGQSPPYSSNHLPRAKEDVYVKIPRLWDISTKVGPYPQGGIYYNGVEEGYEEYVITVEDYQRMRREYIVDQFLKPKRNVTFTPTFHDEWARLRQAGLIDFDVTPGVIEKWMKFERWEHGMKVR